MRKIIFKSFKSCYQTNPTLIAYIPYDIIALSMNHGKERMNNEIKNFRVSAGAG
jgi:hypothetical protein